MPTELTAATAGSVSATAGQPSPVLIRQVVELIADQVHAHLADPARDGLGVGGGAYSAGGSAADSPRQLAWRDLYLGWPGTAVFLAAHAYFCSDPRSRAAALTLLAPVLEKLAPDRRPARGGEQAIGGLVGVAGALHALVVTGHLLAEPRLLNAAHEMSVWLSLRAIRADRHLDVVFGSAGALLALLALDRSRPAANRAGHTPLDLAIECGSHLLSSCRPNGAPRGWVTPPGAAPQPGFSHGASGIVLALARLYQRTADAALWDAVRAGARSEGPHLRRLLDRAAQAPSPERAAAASWCHGAAGIALSRCAILEMQTPPAGRDALAADLFRALEIDAAIPQLPLDHLCCGNLGRVEALLRIASFLPGAGLRDRALALTLGVLRALKRRRAFALDEPAAPHSLFRGLPGIGYGLLRLLAPEVPCLLLFEGWA